MFGKIVLWREERGYGFLRQTGRPQDIFFHVSDFEGDKQFLVHGTLVEFTEGVWHGKPVARDVRPLESGEAAA